MLKCQKEIAKYFLFLLQKLVDYTPRDPRDPRHPRDP
jgi:hypothetical protein